MSNEMDTSGPDINFMLNHSLDEIKAATKKAPRERQSSKPARGGNSNRRERREKAAPYSTEKPTRGGDRRRGGGSGRGSGRQQGAASLGGVSSGEKRSVFVGNLPYGTTAKELREFARAAGAVVQVDIPIHDDTGRPKGFGLVKYKNAKDAHRAITTLNEQELGGRPVFLREDKGEKDDTEARGGGDRQEGGRRGRQQGRQEGRGRAASSVHENGDVGTMDGTAVYVGNLAWDVQEDDLRRLAQSVGKVQDIEIFKDQKTGRSRGCGIIRYSGVKAANKAIRELFDYELFGRKIFVREDRGKEREDDSGRVIKVSNLAEDVTWQELKDFCKVVGEVQYVEIPHDGRGDPLGYGIVRLARQRDVALAIRNLDQTELSERVVTVREVA